MQLQPTKQLPLNDAKRGETSRKLLSNAAKRSETDPPKAQVQLYPLGGLPPKARNPLFASICLSVYLSLSITIPRGTVDGQPFFDGQTFKLVLFETCFWWRY